MPYFIYGTDMASSEALARRLEADSSYRILRRLPDLDEILIARHPIGKATCLALLDCETTGLNPATEKIIEIAICKMTIDRRGTLTDLTSPISMLEDPGFAISREIEHLTGLQDRQLINQRFDENMLLRAFDDIDGIAAFNARFDRGFLIRRFPWMAAIPWACAARDIEWPKLGFHGKSLEQLVNSAGHHYTPHRASSDTWAMACLLANMAPDGRTVAAHMIEHAIQLTSRIWADGAQFKHRDILKSNNYNWNDEHRTWWKDVDPEVSTGEIQWLKTIHPYIHPREEKVDWLLRHAS